MKTKIKTSKFDSRFWNDPVLAKNIISRIDKLVAKIFLRTSKTINFMEVCGTHTMAIAASGMRKLFPKNLRMLSGPGCPVCVTSQGDVDIILKTARIPGVILVTFGDMVKVKGSDGSDLNTARTLGADVRVVYSAMDSIKIAKENKDKKIVFAGVGFETTAPTIAACLIHALSEKIDNFFVLSFFKLVPPALEIILSDTTHNISGFILPGHVSTIIGSNAYQSIVDKYKVPCVVSGFEPIDILRAINMLLIQIDKGVALVENEYSRVVRHEGNTKAQEILKDVFKISSANWRAIGNIPGSGLSLCGKYERFDALKHFDISYIDSPEPKGCICGKILMGKALPKDCKLFGHACTPYDAIGPCMVSSEGACAAWYKYGEG